MSQTKTQQMTTLEKLETYSLHSLHLTAFPRNLSKKQLPQHFHQSQLASVETFSREENISLEDQMQLELIRGLSFAEWEPILQLPANEEINLLLTLVAHYKQEYSFGSLLSDELLSLVLAQTLDRFVLVLKAFYGIKGPFSHGSEKNVVRTLYDDLLPHKGIISLSDLNELRNKFNRRPIYKDYLYRDHLEYISRHEFKITHPDASSFITESEIMDDLLKEKTGEQSYEGCIIYGEGGVGKTRLMLELGEEAEERGWEVLVVFRELKEERLILERLEKGKRYVLIFDYIEESQSFHPGLHERISRNVDVNLRIIANCRNSYQQSSGFPISDYYLKVPLDRQNKWELAYEQYIVQRVLKDIDYLELDNEALKPIKPSFAVFLRFLYETRGEIDLRGFDEFRSWVKKRMELTFRKDDFSKIPVEVTYLLTCMPSGWDASDLMERDYPDLLDKLMNDGWVEYFSNGLEATHDTLVDEMLFLHMGNRGNILFKKRARRLLDFADKYDNVDNWLRSFERIAPQLMNGALRVLGNLIDEKIAQFESILERLITSSLFTETGRLRMMRNHPDLFDRFIREERFAKPLSYAMNALKRNRKEQRGRVLAWEVFQIWKEERPDFIKTARLEYSSRLLSGLIQLYGVESTRDWVKQYVAIPILPDLASFVLASWFSEGGDPETVQLLLKKYLIEKSELPEAQFVLKALYGSSLPLDEYRAYYIGFLEKHSAGKNADYVIQAILDSEQDIKDFKPFLLAYFKFNAEREACRYSLQKAVQRQLGLVEIRPYLVSHLEIHATSETADFLLRAWLKEEEDPKRVIPFIKQHLEQHGRLPEARFLLDSWITLSSEMDELPPFLDLFFERNSSLPASRFVIKSWLKKGYDHSVILPFVHQYLQEIKQDENRRYVLYDWLDYNGELKPLKDHLIDYLTKNGNKVNAQYVYLAGLKNADHAETLEPFLKEYLKAHSQQANAFRLFLSWKSAEGSTDAISEYIENWLNTYPDHKMTKRIRRLLG